MKFISRSKLITCFLAATLASLICVGVCFAQTPPETVQLFDIGGFKYPQKVAVDGSGNTYVTDPVKKSISVFGRKGGLIRKIGMTSAPYGIAVSFSGDIYAGVDDSVLILNKSGQVKGSIGGVKVPVSICVSSGGGIYVLDASDALVKVYSSDGSLALSFGGKGSANGKFLGPASMALDEAGGLIYVIDRGAVVTDPYSATQKINVPRVQVFNAGGVFQRSFVNFGYSAVGKIGSASGIAIDGSGRVYISDNLQNIVAVFDTYGNYLNTIYSKTAPYYNPTAVAYGANRLYVVCYLGQNLKVLGIDGYTDLTLSPDSLSFAAQTGYIPPSRAVTITNGGPGDMEWQVTSKDDWIALSGTSGTVGGNSSSSLDVTVDSTGLAPGTYAGTIEIIAPGATGSVAVTMEVFSPPALTVEPNYFNIELRKTDAQAYLPVNIELKGDLSGALTWNASSDSQWLSMLPVNGQSNSLTTANININHTDLLPGAYKGIITVNAGSATTGSPAQITVDLNVLTPLGKIVVTTDNEDAAFDIEGPENYSGSGTNWVQENVPEGAYKITFNPVSGFRTPAGQIDTITGDMTIYFNGTYGKLPDIVVSTVEGAGSKALVSVFTSSGQFTGLNFEPFPQAASGGKGRTTSVPSGAHTAVGDVDGDGIGEIICGLSGRGNPARVTIFRADGTPLMNADFVAFTARYGVNVAAGDLDGDGISEIIAFIGGSAPTAQIRVFKYINGNIVDTGINLMLSSRPAKLDVSAGDINGDGISEMGLVISENGVSGRGIKASGTSSAKFLTVVSAGGIGNWTAVDSGILINAAGKSEIAMGDIDIDGMAEIVLARSSSAQQYEQGEVSIHEASSGSIASFSLATGEYISNIAMGSVDDDEISEIAFGLLPGASGSSTVVIKDRNGKELFRFNAFDGVTYGARVALGDLGY
jgi:hypothetical protein